MIKILSKIEKEKILHVIFRKEDFKEGRQDVINPDNFLQCAVLNLKKDTTFRPHKHIWKERNEKVIAQESWVVIQGSVKCIFYDLDDTIIEEVILNAGDASFTLEGGHNYFILEDNTLVYEYKTGPYEGQKLDKSFIE
jgi:cupin fold WbuC family metalloprotein